MTAGMTVTTPTGVGDRQDHPPGDESRRFATAEGALMTAAMTTHRRRPRSARAGRLVLALLALLAGAPVRAQTPPTPLSPTLQRVVDFARAGLTDEFILATCVTNTGAPCHLSVEDIIYLHKQGVSDPVVRALIETALNVAAPAAPLAPTQPSTPNPSSPAGNVPPPLDDPAPALAHPLVVTVPAASAALAIPAGLTDNFLAETGLNPSLWNPASESASNLLASLGQTAAPQTFVSPAAGLELAAAGAPGDFAGIVSRTAYSVPFTLTATVGAPAGAPAGALQFELHLVSADLQQWVGLTASLRRQAAGPDPGADCGVWVNHTGASLPINARGYQIYYEPGTTAPYTVRLSAGTNGAVEAVLLDTNGTELAAQMMPAGLGPFHLVLGTRTGRTAAWRAVELTPTPVPAAPETLTVPAAPTLDYFQRQLAPYGTWTTLPQFGLCWRPAVPAGWRPYYDGGAWVDTDAGWYWRSDYPWGDLTFHYGRWTYTATGWIWVPGYDEASAWVVWRHADAAGYLGWAPVPPGAVWVDGAWIDHGQPAAAGADFGLTRSHFTFVSFHHFWTNDLRQVTVPRDRLGVIYRTSAVENTCRAAPGMLANLGLDRDRLAAFTHQPSQPVPAAALQSAEAARNAAVRAQALRQFDPGLPPNALQIVRDHP